MFIYFISMRTKDDKKQEALLLATMKLVNEIGFASSSVAKIAKVAGVSPATLYVYYTNKEDLLVSTYLEIKKRMSAAILNDVDLELPVRDILECIWNNFFVYLMKNKEEFRFAEQFSNSPYSVTVDTRELETHYAPFLGVLERGIAQKIIKNVHLDLLKAYIFYPPVVLANDNFCRDLVIDQESIDAAFQMTWDAIKL